MKLTGVYHTGFTVSDLVGPASTRQVRECLAVSFQDPP